MRLRILIASTLSGAAFTALVASFVFLAMTYRGCSAVHASFKAIPLSCIDDEGNPYFIVFHPHHGFLWLAATLAVACFLASTLLSHRLLKHWFAGAKRPIA